MRGFPKHCATKADYDNIQAMFPDDPRTEAAFKGLLDTQYYWEQTAHKIDTEKEAELSALVDPIASLEIREVSTDKPEVTEKYLFERYEDPNCKLVALGFKIEDVAQIAKCELEKPVDEKKVGDAKAAVVAAVKK
jgi:hypothetical protein